ncbi:MAG: PIN domain-containing protein [Lachnospiraceae bacterium]|jgi:predicted nucleic acid-binding protein
MKYLIDTNVILDVLLKREPFYKSCASVLTLARRKEIELYVSASAITDIYYIANQALRDRAEVKSLIVKLIKVVSVAGISEDEIQKALALPWKDFEDSVQYSVALLQKMDGIVTRNPKDYKEAEMKVWDPEEIVSWWN